MRHVHSCADLALSLSLQVLEAARRLNPVEQEGFVVVDGGWRRLKVRPGNAEHAITPRQNPTNTRQTPDKHPTNIAITPPTNMVQP